MRGSNYLKSIFSFISIVILGMMGGQGKVGGKSTRRFGIPAIATFFAISWNGFQWKDLVLLLLIPILIMGYGQNSVLFSLLHNDTLVRLTYATLLSLPFLFYSLTKWIICAILLIVAFQVHAGSFGSISWFGDILIEDIVRFGSLACSILLCVMWRK